MLSNALNMLKLLSDSVISSRACQAFIRFATTTNDNVEKKNPHQCHPRDSVFLSILHILRRSFVFSYAESVKLLKKKEIRNKDVDHLNKYIA